MLNLKISVQSDFVVYSTEESRKKPWAGSLSFSLLYQEIRSSCFCSNCVIAIRSAKLLGSSISHCPPMVCMVSSIARANYFLWTCCNVT
ncbi:hypothetical protein ZWY2020_036794 [Hordeum vulgare]|nr:hypothetical protein ZWY2020_036794 [Hordeum vulgare]